MQYIMTEDEKKDLEITNQVMGMRGVAVATRQILLGRLDNVDVGEKLDTQVKNYLLELKKLVKEKGALLTEETVETKTPDEIIEQAVEEVEPSTEENA